MEAVMANNTIIHGVNPLIGAALSNMISKVVEKEVKDIKIFVPQSTIDKSQFNAETGDASPEFFTTIDAYFNKLVNDKEYKSGKISPLNGGMIDILESTMHFVSLKIINTTDEKQSRELQNKYAWLFTGAVSDLKSNTGSSFSKKVLEVLSDDLKVATERLRTKQALAMHADKDIFQTEYDKARLFIEKDYDYTKNVIIGLKDGSTVEIDKQAETVTVQADDGSKHTFDIPEPKSVPKGVSKWRAKCMSLIKFLRDALVHTSQALADAMQRGWIWTATTTSVIGNKIKGWFKKEEPKPELPDPESVGAKPAVK